MKFVLTVLAFVLSAWGCRPAADPSRHLTYTAHDRPAVNTVHIPVWCDDKVPEPYRDAIVSALGSWNIAFNGYRVFEIAPPEPDPAALEWRMQHASTAMLVIMAATHHDLDFPADGVLGWVDMQDAPHVVHLVVDDWAVRPMEMRTVVMHEIGHTLGLEHFRDRPGTLMYPYYTEQPSCVDHTTAQAVAQLKDWDDRYMNWCE